MKKWLVGLLAAGLCAASAWATSYTLVSSASEITEGNYVIVAGQGDSAMKNVGDNKGRISAEDVTVQDGVISDPDSSLVWTLAKDGDEWVISSETASGTVYAAAPATADNSSRLLSALTETYTLWTIADSATAGLITVGSYEYTDRCLQKNNSGAFFACYKGTQKDVRFFKEGSSEFSVGIVPSDEFSKTESGEFELTEGTQFAHLTAVAQNGEGPYTFSWTGATWAGDYVELAGETLDIPADLATGEYYVTVWATDSSAEPQRTDANFTFTVVPAPQTYTVTVADGISNGSVEVYEGVTLLGNPAEVLEGTTLTVVANPDAGYKTAEITLNGSPLLDGNTFVVEGDTTVSATFEERTATSYVQVKSMDEFEAGADYLIVAVSAGKFSSAMKNAYVEGSTGRISLEEVVIDGDTVESEDDTIVWTIAAGTDGKYTIYNAKAGVFVSAPSSASVNEALLVGDSSAEAAKWTISIEEEGYLATIGSYQEGKSLQRNSNESNKYFANYKGGAKPFLFKKVGPGVFSVTLSQEGEFELELDQEASITATAKNAQGEVTFAWTVDGVAADTQGDTLALDTSVAGGPHEVVCVATDTGAEGATAQASASYTVLAAPVVYEVTIDENIENGSIAVEPASGVPGTEITVTATPDPGYALVAIQVNGENIQGNVFEMPEGGALVGATFEESSTAQATYTVTSTTEVEATGVVPEGSAATFASTYSGTDKYQLTGGTSMTLTLSGYEGATIKSLTLSMHSNGRAGAGELTVMDGDDAIGGIATAAFSSPSWNGSYSADWVDIAVPVTETVVNGNVTIILAATVNSLYCRSFTVEYEPAATVFGVVLDPADDFEVAVDEEATVTATAKNAVGEVTFAWTVDGVAADTQGDTLALDTSVAGGPHEVVCVATDTGAEGATAEASVRYTVAAPAPSFAVTVAEGIENGDVAVDKTEAQAGETVTVTATPHDGYVLEAILVDGESIVGDSFEMPEHDVTVSATFGEVVDYALLPFLAVDTPFTGPWQNAKVTGVTVEGLGSDYNSADGRGGKFDSTGDWLQIKFEGTPDELSYALKGNSISEENVSTFDVLESASGEDGSWTTVASHKSGENLFNNTKTNFSAVLKTDSRYVKFVYTEKVAGNVALYDVYISSGDYSVHFDKQDGFEVEQGTSDSITATVKNGQEPYYFAWYCETAVELNQEDEGLDTLVIPATLAVGDYTVEVLVIDGNGETISKSISFSVVEPAAKYPVTIDDGISNGNVEAAPAEAAEGETVTLTANPEPGFKLVAITVSYGEETLEFTTSPATFAMPGAGVFVSASFAERGDEFVKIASLDALEEGDYVITGAGTGGEFAMLAELSDGNTVFVKRQETAVEIVDNAIAGPAASIVWALAKTDDGWTIHNDNIGYVGYVASGNSAGAEGEASTNSTWTITESNGLFLPQNVGNTSRYLLYNASSPRFACYTNTASGKALAFYKKAGPAVFGVTVDKDGFEVALGSTETVTASAKNGAEPYGYVWSSATPELNGEGAVLAIPDTLAAGEYTVTVTATDSSSEPQTATEDVTFTVVAPAVTYAVTVDQDIPNGSISADKTEAEEGETVTLAAFPADGYKLVTFVLNGVPFEGDSFAMPAGDALVSAEFAEIVKYPVNIVVGILHGSVEADKTEAEAGETVTLTATPDEGWKLVTFLLNGVPFDGNSFPMPEGEAQVSAEFGETVLVTFVPVETESDFVPGEEYLIVACKEDGFTSAMKNAANGDRIGLDEVEIAGDGSIATDNDAIVWEIRAAEEGEYVLYNASAAVFAAAKSDGNYAQVLTDGEDALAQWTLDLKALPEVKIASVAYPSRWLQRNATPNNKFFATYTGSQTTPLLFKKAGFSVSFDKEDGFTVEEGNADSITATALRGVEPVSFVWTGDLEGEGETLAIPADLAQGAYAVTVTATDSSEPPQTATKSISFEVVAPVVRYAITIAEGIENGEVSVDKDLAEAGETVTVTATPASGYELVSITVNGVGIEGNTFTVEGDSVVSATFREILDYATLPFVSEDTPYSGPWYNAELPVGMTAQGLGGDYDDGAAKFNDTGDWLQIKFAGTPGKLSYWIKGNSIAATEEKTPTFAVQESADGQEWTDVVVYAGTEELAIAKTKAEHELSEDSRFVRFFYTEKAQGNVGIYDIYIGLPGETGPTVTVTGETSVRVNDTIQLVLGLENYAGGEFTWEKDVLFGYINPQDSSFWWTPENPGSFEVTFSAMDGNRTIASETVTLTVSGIPALVFGGDDEGTVGTPVNFTVAAEYVADPAVTFMGFLDVPEGSALTDADVALDFPNVTFTPDVAGDYGLGFSAGTAEGGDYVEDLWIVTVAEAPAEPAVTLVDGETTVELGDDFILEFALSNYVGEFAWSADVGEIDEDGYFTWTPSATGDFPVTVAAVSGSDTIASTTVTLTVTGEGPVAPTVTKVEVDVEHGRVTLTFTGTGAEVWGTDNLLDADSWAPVDADIEGDTAIVEMDKHFLRVQ